MKQYTRVLFSPVSAEQTEWLVALLSGHGYEGFEEEEGSLITFIPSDQFDPAVLQSVAGLFGLSFELSTLEEANWNAAWESGFEPVVIPDPETGRPWTAIRASFHAPAPDVEHDLIITPRMSFGTGHHATTFLMVSQMKSLDFSGKQVLDFGTGTGVLAILAKKLGAAEVMAIDYDEWSISNAADNLAENRVEGVRLLQAENAMTGGSYDIILANINRNVIAANLDVLYTSLLPGGQLVVSGFLQEDEDFIREETLRFGFRFLEKNVKNNWLCLRFTR